MKAKTISKVIRKKVDAWLTTLPPDLKKEVENEVIVTGGCIASMLLKESVNDYDIYFRTKKATELIALHYAGLVNGNSVDYGTAQVEVKVLVDRIKMHVASWGITQPPIDEESGLPPKEEKGEFKVKFLSANAITLSDNVQIVVRFHGDPEQIHENYDFVHCKNYWTSKDNKLVLDPAALESLLTKELRYVGSKYPLASIVRMRKFISRQWTITAGQILKMAMQLNDMDLTDPNILEEQLTGVDMSFFAEIIEKLKEKNPDRVDSAYLAILIDKIL